MTNPELRRQVINVYKGQWLSRPRLSLSIEELANMSPYQ